MWDKETVEFLLKHDDTIAKNAEQRGIFDSLLFQYEKDIYLNIKQSNIASKQTWDYCS